MQEQISYSTGTDDAPYIKMGQVSQARGDRDKG